MPGHKGRMQQPAKNMFSLDVTELSDTDNLHAPEAYIRESEQKLAALYGTYSSHYLLGGATCGIYAMVSVAVRKGDKIIVDRFCHKSVISSIILCGAEPVYVAPSYNYQFGFVGGMSPLDIELAVKNNPDAKAVIITSPTYYGTVSDIAEISAVVHRSGMLLLVDEAHGAHFHISDLLPDNAIKCGADMIVQSVHKTLGAFSSGALLHINNRETDLFKVRNALSMFQTSSPSYALLCALEKAVFEAVSFKEKYKKLTDEAEKWRKRVNASGKAYWIGSELKGSCDIYEMDKTRIVVNFSLVSLTGYAVAGILRNKYNIETEMADENNIVCILTPYNNVSDIKKLAVALMEITEKTPLAPRKSAKLNYLMPEPSVSLQNAYFSESEAVDLNQSIGRINASIVCMYPPGIPLVVPGEKIKADHIRAITETEENGGSITGLREGCMIDVLK